ncbi:proteasome assembly chaperone 1 [Lingula anatina]|uniref:Proteasome assembly chaperone 1 n=1 Tax=Lingula anatina TaxID=7574 RepID=A0A1S3JWT8_LINAN|nr:proteasome assembly chaperone 1 [Lingula anatina]|eukprot:XP_013414772.1 proteasome assembly chaperone 1 [Lingula anatina]
MKETRKFIKIRCLVLPTIPCFVDIMATFFGEILPVTSRAVDEDDDEEENALETAISPAVLRWSPQVRSEIESSPNQCLHCSILIIAVGQAATGFTQCYVLSQQSEKIGAICTGLDDKDTSTLSQDAHSDKTCYIYRLVHKPEVVVVQCKTEVQAAQAFSWTQQLFSSININHTYIAVLTCGSVTDFKCDVMVSDLPAPFLRALKTSSFHGQPIAPYLEQPNTISGLPAQLLTHCQVERIAAVLYTCYTDSIHLDMNTMKTFRPVLQVTPLKNVIQIPVNADKLMAEFVDRNLRDNFLYT